MGDGAAFNYIAMKNAIEDSGLEEIDISNEMTGIIVGSGGPSTMNLYKASELGKNSGSKKGWTFYGSKKYVEYKFCHFSHTI